MHILPLGAGQEVGRSCIIASIGSSTVMLDCGLHIGHTDHRRYPDFSLAKSVDIVLITHFHTDHVGALPLLTEKFQYKKIIVMTPPTLSICRYILKDLAKTTKLYNNSDVDSCLSKVVVMSFFESRVFGDITVVCYPAGHVLGACMFYIESCIGELGCFPGNTILNGVDSGENVYLRYDGTKIDGEFSTEVLKNDNPNKLSLYGKDAKFHSDRTHGVELEDLKNVNLRQSNFHEEYSGFHSDRIRSDETASRKTISLQNSSFNKENANISDQCDQKTLIQVQHKANSDDEYSSIYGNHNPKSAASSSSRDTVTDILDRNRDECGAYLQNSEKSESNDALNHPDPNDLIASIYGNRNHKHFIPQNKGLTSYSDAKNGHIKYNFDSQKTADRSRSGDYLNALEDIFGSQQANDDFHGNQNRSESRKQSIDESSLDTLQYLKNIDRSVSNQSVIVGINERYNINRHYINTNSSNEKLSNSFDQKRKNSSYCGTTDDFLQNVPSGKNHPDQKGHNSEMRHEPFQKESLLYTGDFSTSADRHLPSAFCDKKPDVIICESTYGRKVRDCRRTKERTFLNTIHTSIARGGKVLIPTFALGRAQELCLLLDAYWEKMQLNAKLYIHSGMSYHSTSLFRRYAGFTNEAARGVVRKINTLCEKSPCGCGRAMFNKNERTIETQSTYTKQDYSEYHDCDNASYHLSNPVDDFRDNEQNFGTENKKSSSPTRLHKKNTGQLNFLNANGSNVIDTESNPSQSGAKYIKNEKFAKRRRYSLIDSVNVNSHMDNDINQLHEYRCFNANDCTDLGDLKGSHKSTSLSDLSRTNEKFDFELGHFLDSEKTLDSYNYTNYPNNANAFNFKHVKLLTQNYLEDPGPAVILASPAMLSTGPSLHIFLQICSDKKNLVIIPGYCIRGTIGDKVLRGDKQITHFGKTYDVNLEVKNIGFSAHADAKGIMQLIKQTEPKHVVLCHGDKQSMVSLKKRIESELEVTTFMPQNGCLLHIPQSNSQTFLIDRKIAEKIEDSFDLRIEISKQEHCYRITSVKDFILKKNT